MKRTPLTAQQLSAVNRVALVMLHEAGIGGMHVLPGQPAGPTQSVHEFLGRVFEEVSRHLLCQRVPLLEQRALTFYTGDTPHVRELDGVGQVAERDRLVIFEAKSLRPARLRSSHWKQQLLERQQILSAGKFCAKTLCRLVAVGEPLSFAGWPAVPMTDFVSPNGVIWIPAWQARETARRLGFVFPPCCAGTWADEWSRATEIPAFENGYWCPKTMEEAYRRALHSAN